MKYPTGGNCPSTHPVVVPAIFIETVWDTTKFNSMWPDGAPNPFVYSMGDPTGVGQHADYVFGWKGDALQRAMDQCTSFGGPCATLKTQSIDAINRCTQKARVRESVEGWLTALPGCNPIQPGPARATMVSSCSATKDYDADGGPKGGSPVAPPATSAPPPAGSTVVAPPAASTPAAPSTGQAAHYAQCGGTGFSGPTTCVPPYKCTSINQYYSQCLRVGLNGDKGNSQICPQGPDVELSPARVVTTSSSSTAARRFKMPSSLPGVIPNPVYSTFALLGFLACAIPFPWHLEAWNTGTCLYMLWCGIGCLNLFINSIIWHGSAFNWSPVWCDISSRIILGCSFAIPAASLCINRRLYHIASCQAVTVSRAEKRRAVMVDMAIGLGYPCLMIALQYIVQGHRFNIFEDIGCFPFTYNTPVAFVLVHCQPVLIGLISAVYCAMSIRLFRQRDAQFKELLSGHRNLTHSRYVRLMLLAGIEMACTIPLGCWVIAVNVMAGVFPWLGWADTHYGFSRVDKIPAIIWRNDPASNNGLEFTRWSVVVCAMVFFAFFGFADEARKNYRSAVETVAKKMGYSTFTLTGSRSGATSTTDGTSSTRNMADSMCRSRPGAPGMVPSRQRSIDSLTNVSGSLNEKEKGFSPDASFGEMSMKEVSGTIQNYGSDNLSAPPSSGSSSASISRSPSRSSIAIHHSDRSPV
ncbi:hypothetical protein EST38_g6291 [Candolleomyces aberdarensis]|uniref:CBM1 domain-containing protein n=1 Tax=Candolleomyces aberdarensis TaxID=2316362 RepID=A0A4Q2DIF8_9AGAR|nr:hypothetical protein EST38_g6291 [Candolleomyces aberdarensis]